jgi:hypothetical protein
MYLKVFRVSSFLKIFYQNCWKNKKAWAATKNLLPVDPIGQASIFHIDHE